MPITNSTLDREKFMLEVKDSITLVHLLKLGDDMKADIREIIFEHGQKHGEKVCDSSVFIISIFILFEK